MPRHHAHSGTMQELARDITTAQSLVVLSGAGMGLASGIATFRGSDPGAVWANDVMTMGTFAFFREDPVESWRWYRSRFRSLQGALPNAGHHALVALERWAVASGRDFLLVTQNIDTLHRKAGSERLVEVHGRADRVRCPRVGCEHGAPRGSLPVPDFTTFDASPSQDTLPRCPACGTVVRAHVLWFDEFYDGHEEYQFRRVLSAFTRADLILAVGTSFAVGVTEAALRTRAAKWTIDPSSNRPPYGVRQWSAPQEEALPALVAALAAQ